MRHKICFFQKPSVPRVFAFCSFNYFRNKLSMYIKELLFLRESVKRTKDQLNSEQTVPFVVLGNTKVLFIVLGNTKFLFT